MSLVVESGSLWLLVLTNALMCQYTDAKSLVRSHLTTTVEEDQQIGWLDV
jgi:hypothetical protein